MSMDIKGNVLLIDDEPEVARSLIKALLRRNSDINYLHESSAPSAILSLRKNKPEVILLDLTIDTTVGPESGLVLLDQIIREDRYVRVLVLTAHSSTECGIEAIQRGALSYHNKPGDPELLLSLIKDGINTTRLKREADFLKSLNTTFDSSPLNSISPKMKSAIEAIQFAASNNQPLLLSGETGTGKGVFARCVHKISERSNGPFIRYQPNFTNPDLVASELFGHKKGAFTGANEDRKGLVHEADKGTLFIDEIDALPKEIQVLLLEVLQEKTFRKVGSNKLESSDFRLISALNRDPETLVKDGVLRLDFFHRIAHFKIELPALRDRTEDIPHLSLHFLNEIANKENLKVSRIEDSALRELSKQAWPGNIRELQAVVEGAAFRADYNGDSTIHTQDLNLSREKGVITTSGQTFRDRINSFEEQLVAEAMANNMNNQVQAAKSLHMDRTVFRRILERINGQR